MSEDCVPAATGINGLIEEQSTLLITISLTNYPRRRPLDHGRLGGRGCDQRSNFVAVDKVRFPGLYLC
ncbi:hypothetical protein T4D_155 [Trichinella pseudospiralis]|uniref:Uncharacterized protein n=1 Tax=Trichinella pseudospiralis TaxID=6337 RepID=A0A0V1FYJ3_TRIPS|nr:hypothetical protein T4D_155 [Trichinella pseudospiralis]